MKMSLVSVGACLIALACAGGAIAWIARSTGEPSQFASTTDAVAIPALPPAASLKAAVARLDGHHIVTASIAQPPSFAEDVGDGAWVQATVEIPALRDGLDIEPLWEADLAEGVVAEQSATSSNLRDAVAGSTFIAVLPDGKSLGRIGGGMGDVARGQVFDHQPDAVIRASIERQLARHGLKPLSIEILHPLDAAVAVVARADDGSDDQLAEQFTELADDLFGSPPRYEGWYLELDTANGDPIARVSASFRTGSGRTWINPRFEGLVKIVHG